MIELMNKEKLNGEKKAKLVRKHIEVKICGLEVPMYFYCGLAANTYYVHDPEVNGFSGTDKY